MSGLAKVDDYTFTTVLTKRSGYFMTELGLWPFWVVDQKVIASTGEDVWFTKPGDANWQRAVSHDRASAGPIDGLSTRANLVRRRDRQARPSSCRGAAGHQRAGHPVRIRRFQPPSVTGARASPPPRPRAYTSDSKLKSQLELVPIGLTFWVGFNLRTGPLPTSKPARPGGARSARRSTATRWSTRLQPEDRLRRRDRRPDQAKACRVTLATEPTRNANFDAAAGQGRVQDVGPQWIEVKGLNYNV